MSPALLPARPAHRIRWRRGGHRPFRRLEDVVLATLHELDRSGAARCPVCCGSLRADGCEGCGSILS